MRGWVRGGESRRSVSKNVFLILASSHFSLLLSLLLSLLAQFTAQYPFKFEELTRLEFDDEHGEHRPAFAYDFLVGGDVHPRWSHGSHVKLAVFALCAVG